MKILPWPLITGIIALAGVVAGGFLFTVQILGPHARRPRYGASSANPKP